MIGSATLRIAVSAFFVAALFVCRLGFAQQMPGSDGPTIVPPHVKNNSSAAYPEQAIKDRFTGSATVTLVLEIDASGVMRNATVAEPQGHGFDEAAIAAAQKLAFEPATRDGRPMAAKIRFKYVFKAPAPRLVGRVATRATDRAISGAQVRVHDSSGADHTTTSSADGSWKIDEELPPGHIHVFVTAPNRLPTEAEEDLAPGEETTLTLRLASQEIAQPVDAGADADDDVEEITVHGQRPPREVTKRTLGKEEIEVIPGTNGDALRSLQNLPGVARPPPFSGALIVRGSAPGDTNIYIDGTVIPLVYHFGGLSSVIPTELIDKIDFYPGNFSTQFGRGMGGIVDVGLRAPRSDTVHAMAQLDFIDARVMAEGPIFNSGWNFLIAGRRSWFDLWLTPILTATGAEATIAPRYYDYQLELQRNIGKNSSFRFIFFGSDDALSIVSPTANSSNPTFGGDIGFHTSFWRFQARYENRITKNTELRATVGFGEDSIDGQFGANSLVTDTYPLSARLELSQKIGKMIIANVGIDGMYEPYSFNLQLPPPTAAGDPPGGPGQLPVQSVQSGSLFLPAAYAELEVTPFRNFRVIPGVRLDFDSATSDWDFAPRIVARYDLFHGFRKTTLKGGAGVFDQPPTPFQTDPKLGEVGLSSNRAIHYDVGVEQEFTRQIDMSVDGFYKSFQNIVEVGNPGPLGGPNSGSGFAYGVELLLRYKPDNHFFGWISYTLSRSERQTSPSQPLQLFEYDQTHILTILGSYKWGKGWRIGGRFRIVSGDLYTPTNAGAFDASVGEQLGVAAVPAYGQRLPLFWAFDIRADKTWTFRAWKREAKFSMYIDIQNLFNASDPQGLTYNFNYTQSAYINGLPILPIIGLRGEL